MSDRATLLADLAGYANGSATTVAELTAEPAEVFSTPALAALMRLAQAIRTQTELDELLAGVAPLVRAADPFRASALAISCGTLVEFGADPGALAPPLLAELPRHLALAARLRQRARSAPNDPDALFADDPDGFRAAQGLTYFLLATMAVLCRGAAFRQAARANPEITAGIAALRTGHREANFVAQVLDFTDGMELLVLVPEKGLGFRVALEAVNFNFHLFTLLQAALIGGGHLPGVPPTGDVVAVATGAAPHRHLRSDHAQFHFYTWQGLLPDGSLAATDLGTWIPGEGRPSEIPPFEGTRIVLIGPALLGARMWDSNFFANIHDALESSAEVVEELAPEQVTAWLTRIRQAPH
jgi:hypothetical protein